MPLDRALKGQSGEPSASVRFIKIALALLLLTFLDKRSVCQKGMLELGETVATRNDT